MAALIRQVRDPAAIAVLHAAALAEQGRSYPIEIIVEKWSQVQDAHFLVADVADPVAFLAYQTSAPETCYISDLYVVPAYRRRGLARDLIAWMTGHFSTLSLHVDPDNQGALHLYREAGFLQTGVNTGDGRIRMELRPGN